MKEREGYHKRVMDKEMDLEKKRENAQGINRVCKFPIFKILIKSNDCYLFIASKTIHCFQATQ